MSKQIVIHDLHGTRCRSRDSMRSNNVKHFHQYSHILQSSINIPQVYTQRNPCLSPSSPRKNLNESMMCTRVSSPIKQYPCVRFVSPAVYKENLKVNQTSSPKNLAVISNNAHTSMITRQRSPLVSQLQQNQTALLRKIKILEARVQELHNQKQALAMKYHSERQALIDEKNQVYTLLQREKHENSEKINKLIESFEKWKQNIFLSGVREEKRQFSEGETSEMTGNCNKNNMIEQVEDSVEENKQIVEHSQQKIQPQQQQEAQVVSETHINEIEPESNNQKTERPQNPTTGINPFSILFQKREKMFGPQMMNCNPLSHLFLRKNFGAASNQDHNQNNYENSHDNSQQIPIQPETQSQSTKILNSEIRNCNNKIVEQLLSQTS